MQSKQQKQIIKIYEHPNEKKVIGEKFDEIQLINMKVAEEVLKRLKEGIQQATTAKLENRLKKVVKFQLSASTKGKTRPVFNIKQLIENNINDNIPSASKNVYKLYKIIECYAF